MAFSSRFKRSGAGSEVLDPATDPPSQETGEEIVIDAEATEVVEAPSAAPIRRAAAVPEAAEPQAVAKRSDREVAVRNVAVATAGGLVAGAATIAVAAVAKSAAKHATAPTPGLSRRRKKDILQSQSFLVDVHLLKPGR
jgi:hypothetical protein